MGNLTVCEALAREAFGHVNCHFGVEFNQDFLKSQMPRGRGGGGEGCLRGEGSLAIMGWSLLVDMTYCIIAN